MTLAPGTYVLGPGTGSVRVLTFRDGVAARAGHDLVLEVGRWSATLSLGDDGSGRLEATADAGSLVVVEGRGGVKPLSDRDRGEILRTIDAKVLRGRPIALAAQLRAGAGGLDVAGELTIAGSASDVDARLAVDASGRLTGTVPLVQSRWGIKPYRGLMGALRLRDEVTLELDALPALA